MYSTCGSLYRPVVPITAVERQKFTKMTIYTISSISRALHSFVNLAIISVDTYYLALLSIEFGD